MERPVRIARRQLAAVLIEGLNELGFRLAQQLVGLGIGTVLLRDDRPVTAADTAYRARDAGRSRAESAASMLTVQASGTAVVEVPEGASTVGVDLHLITAGGRFRAAAAEPGAAVLPVFIDPAGCRIGPLLTIGAGTSTRAGLCSECLAHNGLTEDPAGHLSGRLTRDPAAAGPLEPDPLTLVAAGIGAQQTAVLIDAEQPAASEDAVLVCERSTGRLEQIPRVADPECHCMTYLASDTSHPDGVRTDRVMSRSRS